MDKHTFKSAAKALGWVEDAFGHLKSPSGKSRLKFQANSVRLENRVQPAPVHGYTPPVQWINVVSDYYRNIPLSHDNRPILKGKPLESFNG